MLTEGRKMESKFYEWAPLKDENLLLLRKDLNKMVLQMLLAFHSSHYYRA